MNMELLKKYSYFPDKASVDACLQDIRQNNSRTPGENVLKSCFAAMDLTTLHSTDTVESVKALVEKVNALEDKFPAYPSPASICVFSNFASVVRDHRKNRNVHVTVTSACFPTSQSFLEVKVKECEMAVAAGAEEVDIVLPLNSFLAGDYETASTEIRTIREAVGPDVTLKVILETGLLVSPEKIAEASFLSMEAGADFIKTSTGKVEVNATPEAACVMCECIRRYYGKTGRKVGFKAAGGISSAEDAVLYYNIAASVLGEDWTGKRYFRLGVSRLGNSLISAIEGAEVKYF